MTTTRARVVDLRLEPMDERGAAEVGTPSLEGDGPVLIGRGRGCDVCLTDPSVSRSHASLVKREDRWFVVDQGGRHGTYLNGVRLDEGQPAVADQGDFIRLGPYTFRFVFGGSRASTLAPTSREIAPDTIVERVSHKEIGALAQKRLDLLIDGAVRIHQATDEQSLDEALVDLALSGTGFPRAAVIRPTGSADQVEIVAARDAKMVKPGEFSFSRSLMREASHGHIARLSRRGGHELGHSIEQLGITGALCAPIVLDESVIGYIYLDSRANEQAGYADAAGFCHAVSKLAGLALANLKRAELQQRQSRLEEDLKGARHAQAFLTPDSEGEFGRLRYAMRTHPGRFVAGDLFDIFRLDDHRVGICFGDVTGQGVGAAIHMTATLSHLRAVTRYGEPRQAMRDVNRFIAERSPDHMFVSLWVGVFDERDGTLRFVDGGHGHWFIKRRDQPPIEADTPNGLLVGIDPDFPYEPGELTLGEHDRIIIYSDGVIEQSNPTGEAFEKERVVEVLGSTTSAVEDVASLFSAVQEFAGSALDDDTTVASIELK